MDLLDDESPEGAGGNAHEFTVSEISGAVKRSIEDQFGRVRVRGEIGRVSRPGSGHLYFDLKDDRSVLAAVTWKGQAARLQTRPEEGIEVIATGRLTTFPGQSKYQMIVDQIEPAGAGALMVMLEKRRKALAAEGLFDDDRKLALPFLPRVIGVVTSPSGAVIRDILHRLRDRFPTHVLIWPVAVQGQDCAPQVAAAIRGFNDMSPQGPIPRPDVVIVARGGGSLEDLWGFNEEIVVRAAAESGIPLISAVGHETDTTLIDFASDRRAPTPTAAAEMAVPVRADLAARLTEIGLRMMRAEHNSLQRQRQRLQDLGRGLGRPQALTDPARQRFDLFALRLEPALRGFVRSRRERMSALPLSLSALRGFMRGGRDRLSGLSGRLSPAASRQQTRRHERLLDLGQRLDRARDRMRSDAAKAVARDRQQLAGLTLRLAAGAAQITALRKDHLARMDRLRQTLGYHQTLERGFAVLRGPGGQVVTTVASAHAAGQVQIQLQDGHVDASINSIDQTPPEPGPKPPRTSAAKPQKSDPDGQKSLF